MLLAIDVGNTQTVIGLYDDAELRFHWRIAPTPSARPTNMRCWSASSSTSGAWTPHPRAWRGHLLVVPRVTAALREMTESWFGTDPVVLEPGTRTGMPILYDNPKEVGADRIANGVGAYDLYGGPCIVVDFGTATTVDAVSDKGEYLGGAIFPGIEISLDALFGRPPGCAGLS